MQTEPGAAREHVTRYFKPFGVVLLEEPKKEYGKSE